MSHFVIWVPDSKFGEYRPGRTIPVWPIIGSNELFFQCRHLFKPRLGHRPEKLETKTKDGLRGVCENIWIVTRYHTIRKFEAVIQKSDPVWSVGQILNYISTAPDLMSTNLLHLEDLLFGPALNGLAGSGSEVRLIWTLGNRRPHFYQRRRLFKETYLHPRTISVR